MNVEVITIGDELLLGHTIDTNAAFISRELARHGLRVSGRATVGDHRGAIQAVISGALQRADAVICTGGLGPTQDDVTREAVAALFDAPLQIEESLVNALRERFAQRGLTMSERNLTQAQVPRGATVLPNARGTAPGLVLQRNRRYCILLPGVPHELRALMLDRVIPFLTGVAGAVQPPIAWRVLRTTGLAESTVAERVDRVLAEIAPLTLAFLPDLHGTDVRITSWGELPRGAAERALDKAEQQLRQVLGDHVYGTGTTDLAEVVGSMLEANRFTIVTAESCTGGLVGKRLTDIAGSSAYVLGGLIAYDNALKVRELRVDASLIEEHGAVSEPVVQAMARGALEKFGADTAIAITGIAGPTGGSPEKPIGLVWFAAAVQDRIETRRAVLPGDRQEIRERAAQASLALLWRLLRNGGPK